MTNSDAGDPSGVTLVPVDFDPFASTRDEELISREPATGRRPLSASQRRLWFFDRFEPGSSAYNIGLRLSFEGSLDAKALERSLALLVARHETLRSSFREEDGEPWAVVAPAGLVPLRTVDLSASALSDAEAEAERVAEAEAATPFDLGQGPLLRAHLVRLSESRHLLVLTIHHIVSDGWSLGVVAAELLKAYEELAQGREPALPPLAFEYGDFAAWEQRWLTGAGAKQQLDYWRENLAAPLPVLDLPTDFPRPKVQTFRGGVQVGRLSADLTRRVVELSRQNGATPFMTFLAAFAVVMSRQSGQDELPIGAPVAGRNRSGTEGLVGVFINTVVLRCDLQGDPTFTELLVRTRALALQAYRNAEVPFDRVVDAAHPRRDPGRTPLFQVLLNSLDFSARNRFELPSLVVEVRGAQDLATSKFDLTLYMGAHESRMGLALSYNADLFAAPRMAELLAQFEHVLDQVTARPEQRLAEISLLTPAASTRVPNPRETLSRRSGPPVLGGLAELAAQEPTRPAVTDPRQSLDYATLERLSRGLAQRLRGAGIVRGDVVAIRASRSVDLVWGMTGVLRAGAAFVILDSAHPAARIAASIEAAGPRAWLECPGLPDVGPEVRALLDGPGWALQALLEPAETAAEMHPESFEDANAEDLAYVAFTSGTTGGVKGISGDHGPLAHFLNWHTQTFNLGADDRFSMISGLSHDPLLRDVFTPIRCGASLHIPDPDDILAPGRLRDWMARERITVAHLTPAVARLLADDCKGGDLPHLRYAFLGGDVLKRDEVDGLRRVAPAAQIVNFYGATETPQAMGWHLVPAALPGTALPLQMPIGRGIEDVQLLVVSKGRQLAGIGEIGEIAVRTPHLARGYVRDEALTRARFVTSPFSADPEDRLYLTGDLGRYLPDGSVVFAGRADTQVKVRGFRVELGEVEAALRECPGIEGAAVLAHEGSGGDQRLVAYLAHGAQGQPNVTGIRQFLKALLPAHMVPSTFVFLDRLPLTPGGKLDRKALMQLEAGQGSGARDLVAPRTPAETFIAELWRDALGVQGIGVHDNFFDLGGHSLLAMRILAAIEKKTGLHLHPRVIIFQTLEQIAASCASTFKEGLSPAPAPPSPGLAGRLFGTLRKLVPGGRAPSDA